MIDIESNVAPKHHRPRPGQAPVPRESWNSKAPVGQSDELQRILALPRRERELDGTPRAETIIDIMTERFARPRRPGTCACQTLDPEAECIHRLRLVQAVALREIGICGGLLGPIGVGHGKTIIDLLAPLAFAELGIKLSVLLVPPGLVKQLIGDYQFVGQHFRMPRIVFHGNPYKNTEPGDEPLVEIDRSLPIMHVLPYSQLRLAKYTDWLEKHLKPEAVISDECHRLRNIQSATGARVWRYMETHIETRFAAWSGSITGNRLTDMDHLSKWALRGGSPLPNDRAITEDWCRSEICSRPDNAADPGPLIELCNPGERLIDGFRRRLAETIGVVTTTAPPIDTVLDIDERPAPPIPRIIEEHLEQVRAFVRPDGEELTDSLAMSRCAREVACGFYNMWIFPHNVFPRDEALVDEWKAARKDYNKELRYQLFELEEHLDSPLLCWYAAQRAWGDRPKKKGLPDWKARTYPRWHAVKDKVKPETKPVRIDPYLVLDTIRWARENTGIIWYEQTCFGEWVAELGDIPMYGGGKNGGGLTDDFGHILEDGSRPIALSIKAHGTGRNGLQHRFSSQHIPNPPANSDGWEQVLGRLHRIGQKAPTVFTKFYRHTKELRNHVEGAMRAALYVEGALGAVQKLRLGFKLGIHQPDDASD